MAVAGWVLIGVAFLAIVMAINGSWTLAWAKFKGKEASAGSTAATASVNASGTGAA